MKAENLNMSGLNEEHPSLSDGYLIILKSPNTHQAKSHHDLTMSSSAHNHLLVINLLYYPL